MKTAHPTALQGDQDMAKKRNIEQELLNGVRAIKRDKGKRVAVNLPKDVRAIREKVSLSQSAFAALLGVSKGRRTPTGPAYSLLRVAKRHPKAPLT